MPPVTECLRGGKFAEVARQGLLAEQQEEVKEKDCWIIWTIAPDKASAKKQTNYVPYT